jgi:hypothetical protein
VRDLRQSCLRPQHPGFRTRFLSQPDQISKSADEINWVRYTDSAEGAFSMDVPVGWQVQGGMYHFGYFDVRWMMAARSLDEK